jgi:hypothetical protein
MTIQTRLVTTTMIIAGASLGACDASRSSGDDGGVGSATVADDDDGDDDAATGDDDDGGSEAADDAGTDGGPGGDDADDDADDGADTGASDDGGDTVIEAENLIDDLEDGDALIYGRNGRQGAWYTYNDESEGAAQNPEAMTNFLPIADGAPSSPLYKAHTDGTGFATWGFGMGIDLNNEGDDMGGVGMRAVWDGSAHTGIAFRARGTVAMRLKVLVEAVVPTATGGTCTDMCEDSHGKIIPLGDEWTQYVVPFDELFQEGWGFGEVELDPATLMSIQFQVAANTDGEVEIDELGFY